MSSFEHRRAVLRTTLGITDHKSITDVGLELNRRGLVHLTPRRPNATNPVESLYNEATNPWPEFGNRGPDFDKWDKWYQYDRYHLAPPPEPK